MRSDTRTIRAARTWARSPRRRGFTTRSTSAGRLDVIAYRATLVDRELVQFVAKLLATERHWRKTPKGSQALTCFWQAVLGLRWFRDRTTPEALARPRRERAGCHAPGRAPAVDLARRAWVGARHHRRPHPRPARPLPRRRSRRRPRIRGLCDAWANAGSPCSPGAGALCGTSPPALPGSQTAPGQPSS